MNTKTKTIIAVIAVVVLLALFIGPRITGNVVNMGTADTEAVTVKLETTKGDVIIELDSSLSITAGNFEKLVREGFYDGVIFHRVIPEFMIQGGDPTGTGRGGPGYTIADEFPKENKNNRGTISMANAGPNTGGSQFFINVVDNNYLDGNHPVFGRVVEGMNVIDAISLVQTGPGDKPVEDVIINKASIL